jgi:hypothetical protein
MPITTERENIQILRDGGFTQQQAAAVAEVIVRAFYRSSGKSPLIDAREERIAAADARVDEARAQTRRAWRIQAAMIVLAGLAIAIIKLFPHMYQQKPA